MRTSSSGSGCAELEKGYKERNGLDVMHFGLIEFNSITWKGETAVQTSVMEILKYSG
jgi:hypothetical protein